MGKIIEKVRKQREVARTNEANRRVNDFWIEVGKVWAAERVKPVPYIVRVPSPEQPRPWWKFWG